MSDGARPRVSFAEATGILPLRERLAQARVALRGAPGVPPSRYDLTSLSQLRPRISLPLWLGRQVERRTVLVTNLFNHTQTPIAQGWSVRRTQVRDFRGRGLTYDSHNGTDFAIPVGTPVLAAAEGRVVLVRTEFNRGGLKLTIDHGGGLLTCSAHLARLTVGLGDRVHRGQPVALSGYSGLDGFATFPWGVPHIHFNVWLDGEPVDPFPHDGQPSLWRGGDRPTPAPPSAAPAPPSAAPAPPSAAPAPPSAAPAPPSAAPEPWAPSRYDPAALDAAIDACTHPETRDRLSAIAEPDLRGAALIAERNYYPTRFAGRPRVNDGPVSRSPRLDLPFAASDFDGVRLLDER